jgi:hypothetical protein
MIASARSHCLGLLREKFWPRGSVHFEDVDHYAVSRLDADEAVLCPRLVTQGIDDASRSRVYSLVATDTTRSL